jgi:hypothetical protein
VSERRYVVELTKPVPASKVASASQEIARRLGLEVSRVVTLLKDRVGPVTKPVLAAKADAIAAVFQEAGVPVAIYDAAAYQTEWGVAPVHMPDMTGPAAPAPTAPPEGPTAADEPVAPRPQRRPEGPDDDASHEVRPEEAAPGRETGSVEPAEGRGGVRVHAYGPVTPVPEMDGWDLDDPWNGLDPWREPGLPARRPEAADDVTVVEVAAPGERDRDEARPEPGWRGHEEGGDLPVAVRQTIDEWPLPPAERGAAFRPGLWEARGERRPLRAVLVVALVAAVVVFVALQLVYGARSGAAPSYEDGLAAYRVGDFAAARRTWERAADAGSARAQFMLGYLAQHGLGREWSYREAAQRYGAAAAAGLPEAQLALGELYLGGLGVPPDEATGASWVRRAAAAGHGPALYRLGQLYFHGTGVAQDFEAALAAFAAAAQAGVKGAGDYVALADHLRGENVSAP